MEDLKVLFRFLLILRKYILQLLMNASKHLSISQNSKVMNGLPLKEQILPMGKKMKKCIHWSALMVKGFISQLWALVSRMRKFGT